MQKCDLSGQFNIQFYLIKILILNNLNSKSYAGITLFKYSIRKSSKISQKHR